jgi:putative transposase
MKQYIEPQNKDLSIKNQCKLLGLPSSTYYYEPIAPKNEQLRIMEEIDIIYLEFPFYGSRKMAKALQNKGYSVGRKRARRLMYIMGIEAIYQKPRTSTPHPEHKKYPYLLRGVKIIRANQVWSTDITYIKLKSGWTYMMAVIDWYSRKVISWGLSNTMDTQFCTEVLEEALNRGKPEIFNTDQGSQFTSIKFTDILKREKIKISMDGKGRYLDNIYIERFWRTVKYENIFINDYEKIPDVRAGLKVYILQYNNERLHQALDYKTPDSFWKASA